MQFLYMAVVLYSPALAIQQGTIESYNQFDFILKLIFNFAISYGYFFINFCFGYWYCLHIIYKFGKYTQLNIA